MSSCAPSEDIKVTNILSRLLAILVDITPWFSTSSPLRLTQTKGLVPSTSPCNRTFVKKTTKKNGLVPKTSPCYFDSTLTSRCDLCQIVTTVWELVTVATWTSLGLVVHVNRGNLSVLIVTGGFLKMSLISKMTRTCVVTQTAVPRTDHGVIQLTQMFDGNTATYLDVPPEVNLVIKRTYARAKEHKWK